MARHERNLGYYPRAEESKLYWSAQRKDFYAVIEDLVLSDITFVIFDFGVLIGSQMLYFYPDVFSKVIIMDIPLIFAQNENDVLAFSESAPGVYLNSSLAEYQQNNIKAFLNDDDELMMYNINTTIGGTSPCAGCRIAPDAKFGVGARTGWPYYNLVRTDKPWTKDEFDVPFNEWKLSFVPTFSDNMSILHLYATDFFQSPTFFKCMDNKQNNDGYSEYIKINDADHWMQVRQPSAVNTKIAQWINSTMCHCDVD